MDRSESSRSESSIDLANNFKVVQQNQAKLMKEIQQGNKRILDELQIISENLKRVLENIKVEHVVQPEIRKEVSKEEQEEFYKKLTSTENQEGYFGLSKDKIKKIRFE